MPPQSLIDAVRNRLLVPFVGAGLSVSVGPFFPTWRGLIERLATRLVNEALPAKADAVRAHLAAQRFAEAAELAFDVLTPGRFNPEMVSAFDIAMPSDANLTTVAALWRLQPGLVITTNYDDVLRWPVLNSRRPYSSPGTVPRLAHNDDPDFLREMTTPAAGDQPTIWHLHGSVKSVRAPSS